MLASILGPIDLIPPTTPAALRPTVRDAIADMPAIDAGGESGTDALHRSSRLSPLNVRRIRASKPGGTWRDWDEALIAECHRKPEGRTYPSVYGRMEWDHPSPHHDHAVLRIRQRAVRPPGTGPGHFPT